MSLYSGAGGLDLGFADAGFELRYANDIDNWAVETYRQNIGTHAICGDVLKLPLPEDEKPDVLIGGPPCQGFSVIGRMRDDDPRSQHVFHFLSAVEQLEPRTFVMENVKALGASARWAQLRQALVARAEELGYHTRLVILNATDYGVPQARERMFLLGSRDGEAPERPAPTVDRPVTVREALASLPPYGTAGNAIGTNARVVPAPYPVMRPTAHVGSLLFNGSGRPVHLDSPAKTLPASMGGNATPIIDQEELDHGAEPWVVEYHRHLASGGKPYKKAPARLRRLTVEECAVLQSFPADFQFAGPRGAQYRQVGNAVPPHMSAAVAKSVLAALEARQLAVAA